jgi:hypothetical protein
MKRSLVLVTLFLFLFSIQIGYAAPLTSTLKDQQNVAITIYNSNVGLVKDTRLIDLKAGILELKFMDVAAKIDPTTVHIKSLTQLPQFQWFKKIFRGWEVRNYLITHRAIY